MCPICDTNTFALTALPCNLPPLCFITHSLLFCSKSYPSSPLRISEVNLAKLSASSSFMGMSSISEMSEADLVAEFASSLPLIVIWPRVQIQTKCYSSLFVLTVYSSLSWIYCVSVIQGSQKAEQMCIDNKLLYTLVFIQHCTQFSSEHTCCLGSVHKRELPFWTVLPTSFTVFEPSVYTLVWSCMYSLIIDIQ